MISKLIKSSFWSLIALSTIFLTFFGIGNVFLLMVTGISTGLFAIREIESDDNSNYKYSYDSNCNQQNARKSA